MSHSSVLCHYPCGGGISLYNVSCASLTKNSCNTKMVFSHFDSDSCGSSLWQSKGSEAWRESVWIPRPVAVALAHREAPRIHSVIPGCVSATVRSCNVISWPEPRQGNRLRKCRLKIWRSYHGRRDGNTKSQLENNFVFFPTCQVRASRF